MKATNQEGVYTWPLKEDTSWQPRTDIIMKLSNPELLPGRGLRFKFNFDELVFCQKSLGEMVDA